MARPRPGLPIDSHVPERPWFFGAACIGMGDLFFCDDNDTESIAAAKQVCSTCPVRKECLERSLANKDQDGVWGGMTTRERNRLARRRRAAAQVA